MLWKHQLPNSLIFPVIILLCRFYLKKGKYPVFKKLAYEKMFKWQWKVLDSLFAKEDET